MKMLKLIRKQKKNYSQNIKRTKQDREEKNSIILGPIWIIWRHRSFKKKYKKIWHLLLKNGDQVKGNTSPAFEWANLWNLLSILYGMGLALLLYFLVICLFIPKKNLSFRLFQSLGCIESKNKMNGEKNGWTYTRHVNLVPNFNPQLGWVRVSLNNLYR